jgi:hypothetical protein
VDHNLAVWIWPRALPLAEIFGSAWDGPEIRSRFLTLTSQWQARHPDPTVVRPDSPRPGQWMWHPPARRVYDSHTYGGSDDDWLEVGVRLEAIEPAPNQYRVGAALAIACRCESGHGPHTVVDVTWHAGGPIAALEALTTVLRYTDQWLANSRRPEWWRRHAGLE